MFLFVVLVIAIVLAFFYYRDGELPFDTSLPPLAVCDEIAARENPEIYTTATSISISSNDYTDGFRYFFKGCFLRKVRESI